VQPLRWPQSTSAECWLCASCVPSPVQRWTHSGSPHWLSHCSTISRQLSVPTLSGAGAIASFALLMQPTKQATRSASFTTRRE
jgi:hypothetical protein